MQAFFSQYRKKHCKNISNNIQNLKNFKEIYDNIIFYLPTNCYKISYNFENDTNNNDRKNLYENLEQFYIINNIQIIKEWTNINESIFKNIHNSFNGNCEFSLIKSYIYSFLIIYYIKKKKKEFLKLNNKIL